VLTTFASSSLLSANVVDVEGFEPAVIDGAKELLKSQNLPMLNCLAVEAGYVLHKIG
jgi:hypothetical protein